MEATRTEQTPVTMHPDDARPVTVPAGLLGELIRPVLPGGGILTTAVYRLWTTAAGSVSASSLGRTWPRSSTPSALPAAMPCGKLPTSTTASTATMR